MGALTFGISSLTPWMTSVRILHQRHNYLVNLAGIVDCLNVAAVGLFWFFLLFQRYLLHCWGAFLGGLFERHNFSSSLLLGSLERDVWIPDFVETSLNLCLLCGHETTVFTVSRWNPALFPGLYPWTCLTISFACSVAFLSHFMSLRQHHLNCQTSLCTNALACISQRLNLFSCFTETLS